MFRKLTLVLMIGIFSFLIIQVARHAWFQRELTLMKAELKNSTRDEPSDFEKRLEGLAKMAPRNDQIWFLMGDFYFRQMQEAPTRDKRLFWIEKAVTASSKAVECNILNPSLQKFRDKTLKWEKLLSKSDS